MLELYPDLNQFGEKQEFKKLNRKLMVLAEDIQIAQYLLT